ncbi:MAG: hypothetical protein M1830_002927 [Pleopsidium flavum]|nr:MAG: hypothetical protein M1830_002927 [Pleopsidium flavum]
MSTTENGFQTRAARLLFAATSPPSATLQPEVPSTGPLSGSSAATPNLSRTEKRSAELAPGSRNQSLSVSSNGYTLAPVGQNTVAEEYTAKRAVRTIPTWVYPLEEDDEDEKSTSRLLPVPPTSAQLAQHNHTPTTKTPRKIEPGLTYVAQREWTLSNSVAPVGETESRWKTFARVSAYPQTAPHGGEHVTEEWLQEHGPNYARPWHAGSDDPEKGGGRLVGTMAKRKAWWKRFRHTILRNPMVPLVIRLTLWCFSLIAMALAVSIHNLSLNSRIRQGPSTEMAIIVDAVALIYILYITYDEYTGKPLGLRSAGAKMRLIFLDLFFIVFDSANLSLAFEALSDLRGPCQESEVNGTLSPGDHGVCDRQIALASVLLVALIAWLMTFSISVLRLIERVVQR